MAYDVNNSQTYSNPTSIFGEDYVEIQSFYQYQFPPRRLSAQSWGLQEILNDSQKNDLYNKMLTEVSMVDGDILYSSTYWLNHNSDLQTIQSMGLSDSTFECDKRKGFSQITNATSNRHGEHKLTALSRRLRDSFAHGRIGQYGEYVLFEDVGDNCITGRIVLMRDDLKKWKNIIETYIAENNIAIV